MLLKIYKRVKRFSRLVDEFAKREAELEQGIKREEPQAQPQEVYEDEKDYIRVALRKLSCTWEEKEEEDGFVIFVIHFQNLLFMIHYCKEHRILRFTLPHFYKVEAEYIDILRTSCNESNIMYSTLTVTYSFSEDETTLRVSLGANLLFDVLNESFDMTLDQLFCMVFAQKQRFIIEFERYKQYIQGKEVLDLEYQYHTDRRISVVLAEQELFHCQKELKLKREEYGCTPITLKEWMRQLELLRGAKFLRQIGRAHV